MFKDVFPTLEQLHVLGISPWSMTIFYGIDLWVFLIIFFIWTVFFLELGVRIGTWMHVTGREPSVVADTVALTAIFALLGLFFAFTYGMSVKRLDTNRIALTKEAEAAGTFSFRLESMKEPAARKLRSEIIDYAQLRADPVFSRNRVGRYQATWEDAVNYVKAIDRKLEDSADDFRDLIDAMPPGPMKVAIFSAGNDFYDAVMTARVAITTKVPMAVFMTLLIVVAAAMFSIGHYGGSHKLLNRTRSLVLVGMISILLTVMVDFDRPYEGLIQVNHLAIARLNQELINNFLTEDVL